MNYTQIFIYILTGIFAGTTLVYFLFYLVRRQILSDAREEAAEMLKEAQDQFNTE